MLVTYGYHPREDYSVDVALAIADKTLENVLVRKYDWPHSKYRGNFGKVLRETKADWLVDLHSENAAHLSEPDEEFLKSSYMGSIGWGLQHDYNDLFKSFFDKYYEGKEVLSYGPTERHLHAHVFQLGLLWYRPFEKSVEFVKNFANHLKITQS